MRKLIFEKQESSNDCGVACLSMIIKYYGGYATNEKLREMSKTTRQGTTAYHMVKCLEKMGFSACGKRKTLEEIDKFPVIAHVTINNNFNHYVVIYSISKSKRQVKVADPAKKIMKMSYEDFEKIYNNVVIEAVPIRKISIIKKYSLSKFILELMMPYKKAMIKIAFFSLSLTLLSIFLSFYFQSLMVGNNLIKIFILFIFLTLLRNLIEYHKNKAIIKLNHGIDEKLSISTYKNIITLPYHYFKNHTTGEVVTRLNDLDSVKSTLNRAIITVFVDGILIIASATILYHMYHILFLIMLISLIINICIVALFKNIFKRCLEEVKEEKEKMNSYIVESIEGIETIKGLNLKSGFIKKLEAIYFKYKNKSLKLDYYANIEYILKDLTNNISMMVVILIGIVGVRNENLTLASLITFINISGYFLEPVKNLIDLNLETSESIVALKRVLDMSTIKEEIGLLDIKEVKQIKIKDLSYSHDDYNMSLKNINLEINSGEKIMVTGKSGGGKTTLLKILKKYYHVNRDMIKINDIDINDIRKIPIAYISQNEILFTDTLKNNLILDKKYEKEEINKIYKKCHIAEIMPLDYLIEENGFNISGGEKQRIVLGRTLITSPSFLIIDEALNQVDVSLERILLKEIMKIKNITLIYVSHRNDNMDLFDRVINIEDGYLKSDIRKEKLCY